MAESSTLKVPPQVSSIEAKSNSVLPINQEVTDELAEHKPFTTDDANRLFKAEPFKVHGSLSISRKIRYPHLITVDSAAGPNFISSRILQPSWRKSIQQCNSPEFAGATGHTMTVKGVIPLFINIGDLDEQIWFGVVDNLPCDVLLGASFNKQHTKKIDIEASFLRLRNSRPVQIIEQSSNSPTVHPICIPQPTPSATEEPNPNIEMPIKLSSRARIPAGHQQLVKVTAKRGGMFSIRSRQELFNKYSCAVANGIAETIASKPFTILIANFANHEIFLPKNMRIATALPAPATIYQPSNPHPENVLAVSSTDFERHLQVQHDIDKKLNEDWHPQLNIDDHYSEHREELIKTLTPFQSMWDGHLGTIKSTQHRIDLQPNAKPVFQQPYRAGPRQRELEKTEVKRMLKEGVIEPCTSEWGSPIVFAPKKDGSLRFCIDYRKLNAVTIRDAYPIPRMDECIDSLADATVFSTLDCNSGYWQVEIPEEERDKTAFVSHHGLFRCTRMPFGLKNAPGTFQRAIDIILATVRWQCAIVYLDDIVIFSNNVKEHLQHITKVLSLLNNAGMTLKLRKCFFLQQRVEYLGHIVAPGQLQVASKTCQAIKEMPPPRTITELRSFLGLCNVYRRFIKGFGQIAYPLTRKLRLEARDSFPELTEEEMEAYESLKKALTEPPVLALPRSDLPYVLDTDASDKQVGAALMQKYPDKSLRPIGYYSRTLSDAERNYDTTHRECLAVIWAIMLLRPYLYGTTFTLRTDHDALKWLLNMDSATGQLARWRLRLAEFDYSVEFRPGIKNQAPDALSRLPTDGTDKTPLKDDIPVLAINITKDQERSIEDMCDDELDQENFAQHPPPEPQNDDPIERETFINEQRNDVECNQYANFVGLPGSQFVYDREGYLSRVSKVDGALQRVVPRSLRIRLLYLAHYPRLQGHPGARRMYDSLRQDFYWRFMANDVFETVRRCLSCAKSKGTSKQAQRFLKLFPANGPFEFVAMDILGPLPKTSHGKQYVLVITDRYTKLARAIPMKKTTAPLVAAAFLQNWIYPYGIPESLLTDNGPQFISQFFAIVCAALGIRRVPITAYHPQTNGQTERYNKTLAARLRHYVNEHQTDWDIYVQPLTYAYNAQVHKSTGTTPFSLSLTRHPPSTIAEISSTANQSDIVGPSSSRGLRLALLK